MDIHVYIHEDKASAARWASINSKLEEIMADTEGLSTAVSSLIDGEHAVAAEMQKLADQVKSLSVGNVTQDQIDAITASVTQVAGRLSADVSDAEAAVGSATPMPASTSADASAPADAPSASPMGTPSSEAQAAPADEPSTSSP